MGRALQKMLLPAKRFAKGRAAERTPHRPIIPEALVMTLASRRSRSTRPANAWGFDAPKNRRLKAGPHHPERQGPSVDHCIRESAL